MTRLVVHGSSGRMGARLIALARADDRFTQVRDIARLEEADIAAAGRAAAASCDVIVDFSADSGALHAVRFAEAVGAAVLVGTTALSARTMAAAEAAAASIAVMIAPNTSLGMAVLRRLAAEAVGLLGPGFDVDVVERHHRGKLDAPSGSALMLADAITAARPGALAADRVHAIRAGDIVGEHVVELAGAGERLRLMHDVTDRDVFVRGALHAAAWLTRQPPGRYAVEASLGDAEARGSR